MPEGAKESKVVGAAMHSCRVSLPWWKWGEIKNYSNLENQSQSKFNRFSHCTVPSSARTNSLSEYGRPLSDSCAPFAVWAAFHQTQCLVCSKTQTVCSETHTGLLSVSVTATGVLPCTYGTVRRAAYIAGEIPVRSHTPYAVLLL